ncbi:similar to Saccharomyces cerevisiae YBR119W MUD1 U1 snRNP A protein, homolog of human U1-A [Maudiozyma saulgeensis]|uniref:Similar to Saccharomyces cerevisiae YBR119W MUD1 U1 snRNP A protein, homolog of human U1-A n=1 Tax=Maudiozyma saulgeensis TaxID=1789683 RepID=A0A1X7QXT9_9SACH|nr:similar to Saccharomyces cerevisiae YBR119W MUD1 U1 snRNP A protein, homolog of human U1-A [Kazachstania saulgeensis]
MNGNIKTLHLSNLPRRPESIPNFIRLLLKAINPVNEYALSPSLDLPTNTTASYPTELELLDSKNNIIAISRSHSKKLSSTCFITFVTADDAKVFLETYKSKPLMVNGRRVLIEYAKKESLLAIALDETKPGLFEKILNTRHKQKLLKLDEDASELHTMKRKSRRLRSKLRKQGLDETRIAQKIKEFQDMAIKTKQDEISKRLPSSKPSTQKQPTHKIIDNPPNNKLLVQNIPNGTTEAEIEQLFKGEGFKGIRLVAVRNVAFIEYESIEQATIVKDSLGKDPSWKGSIIYITFAK